MIYDEKNNTAHGGTEQMMQRLVSSLPKDLLDKFQIIPSRIRDLDPSKKKILWCHDLANDVEVEKLRDPSFRKQFSKIVFVSNWQFYEYHRTLGIPFSEAIVIENGIEPIEIQKKEFDGTIKLIYHTTPHRGLELLVPVFEYFSEKYSNIELDVYSSFNLYGWGERDSQYKDIFARCKNHPRIRYHGAVSNDEIRQALTSSHVYAYPCIWQETSCISVIEAMSAMNLVLCPNYAALPETCSNFASMYQWDEDPNKHVNIFASNLQMIIDGINRFGLPESSLNFQKAYYDNKFNWENKKQKWEWLLNSLL